MDSKRWSKQFPAPQQIVVHSQGDATRDVQRLLSKRPGKSRVMQAIEQGTLVLPTQADGGKDSKDSRAREAGANGH